MQIILARVKNEMNAAGRWQTVGEASVWKSNALPTDVADAVKHCSAAPEEGWTVLVLKDSQPNPVEHAKELVLKAYRSLS